MTRVWFKLISVWTAACIVAGFGLAATAEQRKALAAEELELAKSSALYLWLDPARQTLELRINGIAINNFPLTKAQFGQPRLSGKSQPQWSALLYELVTETPEPDRPEVKIIKEDDNSIPANYIIKEREQMLAQIPTTYRLEFSPDLLVVIRGDALQMDFASRRRRFWFTLEEGWEGFRLWMKNQPISDRLVLFMSPDEARRLFQVLQPKMKLVVASVS